MTGTHIITNNDPQAVVKAADKFCEGKTGVQKIYSATPLVMGLDQTGQANVMVFVTCFIMWECTQDEYNTYLFAQQMALQK